ncbi:MAG: hypothetical protein DRI57_06515 [Deltaproteobacteria bacterium]|nr:MAG: hypothetical protein DRI57_06515 [Deltaproteobacteria bacterium]
MVSVIVFLIFLIAGLVFLKKKAGTSRWKKSAGNISWCLYHASTVFIRPRRTRRARRNTVIKKITAYG